MRVVGVVDLRDNDADQSAAPGPEILRGAVGDIMLSLGLGLDAGLGRSADIWGVTKGLGHGHYRKV
jgi:hypothetical protein